MAFRPVKQYLAALLVLLVLCCCSGTAHAAATDAQKSVTLKFLQGFAVNFGSQLSWSGADYCSWSGVSCDADDYVTLSLASRGLNGYLPNPGDNNDTLVVSIDVSNNAGIKGNFPDSWARLKALKTLNMASTGLYGGIPDAWNGMVNLEKVTITNTKACYGLPNWADMPHLQSIDLSSNNMGGTLASSWWRLTALTSVKITGNNFCGCEPDTWKNVSVLHSAASSLAVANANCATSNQCNSNSHNCNANNGSSGNASAGLLSSLIAMVSMACALAAALAL